MVAEHQGARVGPGRIDGCIDARSVAAGSVFTGNASVEGCRGVATKERESEEGQRELAHEGSVGRLCREVNGAWVIAVARSS